MAVSVFDLFPTASARLAGTGARTRFLSLEPLLGPLPGLDLSGIDWVIVGGESGPGARPMQPAWVRAIRDACVQENVPFFFKQWGGVFKKRAGRKLDGRTWDQMPALHSATFSGTCFRSKASQSASVQSANGTGRPCPS